MPFHSRFHHTHDWALPFFSLDLLCVLSCTFFFFARWISPSLTLSILLFIYTHRALALFCSFRTRSLALSLSERLFVSVCVSVRCVCMWMCVRFHFFWYIPACDKVFLLSPSKGNMIHRNFAQWYVVFRLPLWLRFGFQCTTMPQCARRLINSPLYIVVWFFIDTYSNKTFDHITMTQPVRVCVCVCVRQCVRVWMQMNFCAQRIQLKWQSMDQCSIKIVVCTSLTI